MTRRFQVKICGLNSEDSVDAALSAEADLLGFVFVPGSPRAVSAETASSLTAQAAGRAKRVGLFADAAVPTIRDIVDRVALDIVQLHGTESQGTIGAVAAATGLPVFAARGVATVEDLPVSGLAPRPAAYLFDAKPQGRGDLRGGHGRPFDWDILSGVPGDVPWYLAGGLSPENVGAAAAACRNLPGFAGVDVSSGVERLKGQKDPDLMRAFVAAARAGFNEASI